MESNVTLPGLQAASQSGQSLKEIEAVPSKECSRVEEVKCLPKAWSEASFHPVAYHICHMHLLKLASQMVPMNQVSSPLVFIQLAHTAFAAAAESEAPPIRGNSDTACCFSKCLQTQFGCAARCGRGVD